ncbi:MAG: bifunctional DNA primase/polymerase [Phenylobacterium sp.]|uniref:bifunctional DNA primase/polymerase n=1 Tax=Phenylobacterium sp. TaxID=1871053 RepID=UPI001A491B99|nr:bifunctional DNA primase/polymerase [Phenylobacterium sp.]MBL8773897.1 bifunctional DNA primase/polymerase [Phenylobacterium sp.]
MQTALDYATELGLAVFPTGPTCKPGSLVKLEPAGEGEPKMIACYDGTTDPARIAAYWSRYPEANVSVSTGELSGVFVLDVDSKDGFDGVEDIKQLQRLFGALPRTWRSRTPSGGTHLWFRQPDRPMTNRVHFRIPDGEGGERKSGLDVRTTGGAAAAPPSRRADGAYAWVHDPFVTDLAEAPAWLLDLIDPPLPPRKPFEPVHIASLDRTARYVEAAVNGECVELARMKPGSGRNLRLFMASANLGQLVGANLLSQAIAERALQQAASECGLVGEDGMRAVMGTIASGMKKGIAAPREVRR